MKEKTGSYESGLLIVATTLVFSAALVLVLARIQKTTNQVPLAVFRTPTGAEVSTMGNREYAIAAIFRPDGIGIEVIGATLEVLGALEKRFPAIQFNVQNFDWGSDYYKKNGAMMPADGLKTLAPFDAILFGAVGSPDVPDHVTLRDSGFGICQGFDQYANVRPTRLLPGITSPLRNCKFRRP
ncbi:MAG: isocitrate/isopropylmalate family dehydrogenase [Woeseiaceae bacterium]|nr:isocitrate/isopropylmalate family dehydrogenase [Woeseiaceae bacterium]